MRDIQSLPVRFRWLTAPDALAATPDAAEHKTVADNLNRAVAPFADGAIHCLRLSQALNPTSTVSIKLQANEFQIPLEADRFRRPEREKAGEGQPHLPIPAG